MFFFKRIVSFLSKYRLFRDYFFGDSDLFELIKGSGISFFFKVALLPLSLLTSLVISRRYGSDVLGVYSLVSAILLVTLTFSTLGISSSLHRFIALVKNKTISDSFFVYRGAARILFVSSFFFSLCLFVFSVFFSSYFFSDSSVSFYLKVSSFFLVPYVFYLFNVSFLLSTKNILWGEFISKFIFPVCFFLIVLLFSGVGSDLNIPIWGFFVCVLISCFSTFYFLRKIPFFSLQGPFLGVKELLSVSKPMLISGVAGIVIGYIDLIMLGHRESSSVVGIYSVCLGLSSVISLPVGINDPMLATKIGDLFWKGKITKLQKLLKFSAFLTSFGSFVLLLFFFFLGKYVLSLYGLDFSGAYVPLLILCFGHFLNVVFGSNGLFMNVTGYEKQLQIMVLSVSILNIFLNILLIPKYGITGAAVSTMLSSFFLNLFASLFVYNKTRLKLFISI